MIPHVVVLEPRLVVHKIYNGYWFFGRPTVEELRQDLRAVSMKCRPDWHITAPGFKAFWDQGRKEHSYPYGKAYRETLGGSDEHASGRDLAGNAARADVLVLSGHIPDRNLMCRWIAYRGETTSFEPYVTEPEHSLVAQSIRSLQSTAGSNGDGFGLGWYGEHPEPGLYRETRPAWSDENLRYLCRHLRSHLFFAHVRAATGTAVTRQNCHPFACGHWMFMHNGFVGSWNRLRRKVEALIPDAYYPSRLGTTDSEAVFLAMMGAGLDDDPLGATGRVLQALVGLVNEGQLRERLRFTSAIANGRDLYAFRVAVNDAANTLYYREDGGQVIVVSEPFDKESDWTEVPPNHALIARASETVKIVPFDATICGSVDREPAPARRISAGR